MEQTTSTIGPCGSPGWFVWKVFFKGRETHSHCERSVWACREAIARMLGRGHQPDESGLNAKKP